MKRLDVTELAYVAGVIDMLGVLRTRRVGDADLPAVMIHGSHSEMMKYLAGLTGTKITVVKRAFLRAGCVEHCKEKHQHVESVSARWSVTGAKATILLWNVRPYIKLQAEAVTEVMNVGFDAQFKPATLRKMADLGWEVPEF